MGSPDAVAIFWNKNKKGILSCPPGVDSSDDIA